jgi:hypothetical protein
MKRDRYRERCRGCPFLIVVEAVSDPQVIPLLQTHRHDGRWNLPGHRLLWEPRTSTPTFRCRVDGRRTGQEVRCRLSADDPRLAAAEQGSQAPPRKTEVP